MDGVVRLRLTAGALVLATCLGAAQQAPAGEIQRRKARQQRRIGDGVASGRLSPQEGARLEHQEATLNKEENAMREASGGHLTPGERRVINRQQNQLSRRIYRQKHDGNDR